MSIERQPPKWIGKLLRLAVRTYIRSRSKIVIERNDTLDLKPPYIILANHVNNYDPLFVNAYVPEMISFIAGDSLFRHPMLRKILDYIGTIPKAKFRNDTSTIRNIIKAKKHDRVIGIFPEGNRNWDGNTEPLMTATAKLVKSLDIPVVIVTIRGGYLSHPRWAENHRRGRISLSYEKLWDKGEIKDASAELIDQKLTIALAHNEMDWQARQQTPYLGKALAHYLERFLFICPHCEKTGDLHSNDDLFICKNCDYKVRYTRLGHFEQVNHELIYNTPLAWNKWQIDFLAKILLKPVSSRQFSFDDHVELYVAVDEAPFQLVSSGKIIWNNPAKTFNFQGDEGKQYDFTVEKMNGVNIHLHDNLDFIYEKQVYRMKFYQPRTSAYKWLKTLAIVSYSDSKKEVIS